jgi:hypothetical protein
MASNGIEIKVSLRPTLLRLTGPALQGLPAPRCARSRRPSLPAELQVLRSSIMASIGSGIKVRSSDQRPALSSRSSVCWPPKTEPPHLPTGNSAFHPGFEWNFVRG